METTINSILKSDIQICQPKDGFRFSIDSIILSRFIKVKKYSHILDAGSGSGIIATLLAKLYNLENIDAVELQDNMFSCLEQTVKINNLESIINLIHTDLKNFKPETPYDMIICNPPYRKMSSGRNCNTDSENTARFDNNLNLDNLFKFAKSYLNHQGYLYFSYDADLMTEAIYLAKKYNMEPKRLMLLHPQIDRPAKLIFIECRKNAGIELKIEPPLIQNINGKETEQFSKLFKNN